MLHWIWEAIIGLVVGALAKLIMPGKDPGGILITMLLGIAGIAAGGLAGSDAGLVPAGAGRWISDVAGGRADSAGDLPAVQGAVVGDDVGLVGFDLGMQRTAMPPLR